MLPLCCGAGRGSGTNAKDILTNKESIEAISVLVGTNAEEILVGLASAPPWHERQHRPARKVDVRLPGKGNSNSHGARPVHLIITMRE